MSSDLFLSSDLFGPAWRGSEVKSTPMLQFKYNAPYLDRNNSNPYRLAHHFRYNWRERSRPSSTNAWDDLLLDGLLYLSNTLGPSGVGLLKVSSSP